MVLARPGALTDQLARAETELADLATTLVGPMRTPIGT
jgi:hypothetical protein